MVRKRDRLRRILRKKALMRYVDPVDKAKLVNALSRLSRKELELVFSFRVERNKGERYLVWRYSENVYGALLKVILREAVKVD